MAKEIRLTSVDNPYNPFTQWNEWYFYDLTQGYHTCERLASIATVSDQLSDEENTEIIEEAMDQLIKTGCINKQGEIIEYKKIFN